MIAGQLPNSGRRWRLPGSELAVMVAKIACIEFSIEMLIMFVLRLSHLPNDWIIVDILDATTFTMLAIPIVYWWVARPFAEAARDANAKLTQQLLESQQLLAQNESLRTSLQATSESSAEIHERMLQKVGAELHDGPAQLLSYTLLQLDRLAPIVEIAHENKINFDLEKMRRVLADTIQEVRAISTGLSLPELAAVTIDETISLAIRRHEDLTGSKVKVTMNGLPAVASMKQKVCTYRFVQEALSNALRHGHAQNQIVEARGGRQISIMVQDDGLGFAPEKIGGRGLGLSGMRARVQALGGYLDIQSSPGHGTRVTASFDLEEGFAT